MWDGHRCTLHPGYTFVLTLIHSSCWVCSLFAAGTAVGKLLTLGGVGIWWIIDIVLLVTGMLKPADDSNWVPYF